MLIVLSVSVIFAFTAYIYRYRHMACFNMGTANVRLRIIDCIDLVLESLQLLPVLETNTGNNFADN